MSITETPGTRQQNQPKESKESLLSLIWHTLFGYKYYTTVYNVKGTMELGIGGRIFMSRKEAQESLYVSNSFALFEVVSFRSRRKYITGTSRTGYNCNYLAGQTEMHHV